VPALAAIEVERFMLWARGARAFMGLLLVELAPADQRMHFAPAADVLVGDLQKRATEIGDRSS
jgi:hypothetical protein